MPLYMLGHPSGLPLKLTKGGIVKNNSQRDYISCDLYAFSGNSGSPVFCSATQKVIGILRSGGEDYELTDDYGGKKITRIQALPIESRSGFEKCQRMHTLLCKLDHAGVLNTRPFPKNEVGNFCLSLKNKYKSMQRMPRLLQENILPIETTYTQLVLLQSDKKEEKKEKEKKVPVFEERELRINSWEDIRREKQPIELDKLFET